MSISPWEYGVAFTPEGVEGGVVSPFAFVVAVMLTDDEKLPAASSARTANEYCVPESRFLTVTDLVPSVNAIRTPPLKTMYATTPTSSLAPFQDKATVESVLDVTASVLIAVGGPESATGGMETEREPTSTVDPPTSAVTLYR